MALGVILLEWTDQTNNNTSINTAVLWRLLNTDCISFKYNSAHVNIMKMLFLPFQYKNKM
jgi:hypothetical protein